MEASLSIRRVPVADLVFDPANAREHGPENLDAIVASLQRFGQAEPLVVQARSRRVIGGNGRLAAMKKLGWAECDIVEIDIDDLGATALGIALNRTAELAEWNEPALARLLEQRQGFQEGLLNSLVLTARADFCVQHHHHHRFLFAALVGLWVKLHEHS